MAWESTVHAPEKCFGNKLWRAVSLRSFEIRSHLLETPRRYLRHCDRKQQNSLIESGFGNAVANWWGRVERHRFQKYHRRVFIYHRQQLVGISRGDLHIVDPWGVPGWGHFAWRHPQRNVLGCDGACWKHCSHFIEGPGCRFRFRHQFLKCSIHNCQVWKWKSAHSRLQTLGLSIWEHWAYNPIQRRGLLCRVGPWCKVYRERYELSGTRIVSLDW